MADALDNYSDAMDDTVEDDTVKDDTMEDDTVEDDTVEDDTVEDDTMGDGPIFMPDSLNNDSVSLPDTDTMPDNLDDDSDVDSAYRASLQPGPCLVRQPLANKCFETITTIHDKRFYMQQSAN